MTQLALPPDPIQDIPDPETVRRMLAESVRRSDLLRHLLRLARRKASYERPDPHPELADRKGVADV
jgi:hypothetical protein